MTTNADTPPRCFHCRLPVAEPDRHTISAKHRIYAHRSPACCAIATIQARKAAQVTA